MLYFRQTIRCALPAALAILNHHRTAALLNCYSGKRGLPIRFATRALSLTSVRRMSWESSEEAPNPRVVQVLALHGSEGSGPEFISRLERLRSFFLEQNMDLQITAVTAPFEKGTGFSWWTMPPGVRSFTAKEFEGFETSASLVTKAINEKQQQGPPFDVILGHSQGAILLAALLILDRLSTHPKVGYILNGVAAPNPFAAELETFKRENGDDSPPRILFVFGENDQINPPSNGDKVKVCLDHAGLQVSSCYHPGGHSVPTGDTKALQTMYDWVMQGISS